MVRPINEKLKNTTIQISKKTLEDLRGIGKMGQTIEDVIKDLIKLKKR